MSRVSTLGSEVMATKPRLIMKAKGFSEPSRQNYRNPFHSDFKLKYSGVGNEMLRVPINAE